MLKNPYLINTGVLQEINVASNENTLILNNPYGLNIVLKVQDGFIVIGWPIEENFRHYNWYRTSDIFVIYCNSQHEDDLIEIKWMTDNVLNNLYVNHVCIQQMKTFFSNLVLSGNLSSAEAGEVVRYTAIKKRMRGVARCAARPARPG